MAAAGGVEQGVDEDVLLIGAVSLLIMDNFLANAAGACGLVAMLFIYARLLGRLMWYAAQKEAKLQPRGAVVRQG